MPKNLAVAVIGHRNSGKSETWEKMFKNPDIKSNRVYERDYTFSNGEKVKVFLRNGSFQERNEKIEDVVPKTLPKPHILLCSIQYVEDAKNTIEWLQQNDYTMYFHFLNPGYHDAVEYTDELNLIPFILSKDAMIGIRNGKLPADTRVNEMTDFIYGWAKSRNLIK